MSELPFLFGPSGPLAKALESYESRPQQLEMALAVERTLADEGRLLVEAGTGCGKSFAYAVPLLRWLANSDRRAAISTNTKTLQQQLFDRDLPFLLELLGLDLKVELCMGSSNYVCLRQLDALLQAAAGSQPALLAGIGAAEPSLPELQRLNAWCASGGSGLLEEVDFPLSLAARNAVGRNQYACNYPHCPYAQVCPYFTARRRFLSADLLLVNHHLLLLDTAKSNSLMGKLDALVLDEAQSLESVASSAFGLRLSRLELEHSLTPLLAKAGPLAPLEEHAQSQVKTAQSLAKRLIQESRSFFSALRFQLGNSSRFLRPKRLRERLPVQNSLSPLLEELLDVLEQVVSLAAIHQPFEAEQLAAPIARLQDFEAGLEAFSGDWREDLVYWAEPGLQDKDDCALCLAPVEPAPLLSEQVFQRFAPLVLTSATLRVRGDFEFILQRLGLEDAETLAVASPFDYGRNCRLFLPPGLPDPAQSRFAFEEAVLPLLARLLLLTSGRTFVLFTSYAQLSHAAHYLRERPDLRFPLLVQGEAPRRVLLERFTSEPGAVLLATRTFWQGVDIPGAQLVGVIIVRLPFNAPDDPLFEARCELLESRGLSSFANYALPSAVLELQQAFGRLIRTTEDYGYVAVLDPRLRTRNYGRFFLDSLPRCPIIDDLRALEDAFAGWEPEGPPSNERLETL